MNLDVGLGLNMSMLGDLDHLCGILDLGLDMDMLDYFCGILDLGLDMRMRLGYDLALDLVLDGLWNSVYHLALGSEFRPFLMA